MVVNVVYTLDNFDNNDGWIHKFNNYGSFLAVVLIVMHHNGVQLALILAWGGGLHNAV